MASQGAELQHFLNFLNDFLIEKNDSVRELAILDWLSDTVPYLLTYQNDSREWICELILVRD
ncbi:hypothetical protein M5D96_003321 [Drosophila gunungcola]|uniref:Uncharacterized protein n=1 Tax=Drosophila gunungcola TaxID=103775 RepID=A0A9Q0BS02_9MUSC|nr:hypothetical protein M5D96_003321 [Drosophila gunungcola]